MISKRGSRPAGERQIVQLVVQRQVDVMRLAVAMVAHDCCAGSSMARGVVFVAAPDRPRSTVSLVCVLKQLEASAPDGGFAYGFALRDGEARERDPAPMAKRRLDELSTCPDFVHMQCFERRVGPSVAAVAAPRQAQNGSGTTEPVSPARRFTDTTVAFGKKLNSEALAQV